ncbi:hypothetical protein BGZ61DRAFT_567223 [Ilyonectria robusta]|uniref:uncharacterized protein n=1 Tax=Ilyonectria robusta TaxID=1079257 RepID=UPI001E8E39CC|nr:uncharacterized protein BGZ61DRAFT_567223 [Ilyonectria robusta]KAH8659021.1 hypothetical protein BGZ61DRAFT_567223 [Ilyonectria robusta]
MANIGRIAFAGLTAALESTQALANVNFDFSLVKVEAPCEFHGLGQLLTHSRRESAEDGPLHVTARRLAAIFGPLLPQTPELIRCYGLRASEISRESTQDAPPVGVGIFAQQVGIDGASIWAGATSGVNAIQVHLLACMLARIWTGPEAISIWVELLKSRRDRIQAQVANMDSVDIGSILAAKQDISRDQLGEWDASARAWLRIADTAKRLQQKQLLLIIGNMETFVNSKPVLYDSVIKAWTTSLTGMEELLNGSPLDMRSGDLPLALTSWHLYPDLNIVGPATKVVHQKDTLVPQSGILTIGLQGPSNSESNGLHWSLPLAHLRFYGGPVQRSHAIRCEGARLSLVEFNVAVLGCVLGGWGVEDDELEKVIDWVSRLSDTFLAFFKGQVNLERTWLSILGEAASTILMSEGLERRIFTKLLNMGRRRSSFIGHPSRAFFGLCKVNNAVVMAKDSEERVAILRSQAARARLPWNHAIIRYVSEVTGGEEFASATALPVTAKKRASSEETRENVRHVRWIQSNLPPEEQQEPVHLSVKTDAMRVVWGTPAEPLVADWDPHDHWFGEMKHYEHWLGDPHSAAIFIRLDQSMPENDVIPFTELASLFERQALSPSRMAEKLAEFLEQGDQKYVGALKAIATMNSLYSGQNQTTIDVNVFERSLVETKWLSSVVTPRLHLGQSFTQTLRRALQPSRMSISQSFSGILFFENLFDIPPSQVSNVMAMSTGNSLFIAASLLCDPAKPPRGSKIRHVMGNVGKPGMALLVPPVQPRMMTLGIDKWHLIDLARWDGVGRDSFEGSTLHLWFTGKNQEVDVGYTGAQDQELYILESVVSLYGKGGEWVADLDILKMQREPPFVYQQEYKRPGLDAITEGTTTGLFLACHGKHVSQYRYEDLPLATVENWAELIEDMQSNYICMATGNWQARLAAAMVCIAQGRRVCLLPDFVCWQCVAATKNSEAKLKDPTVYIH